jgi:hypothetical protein
MFGTVPGSLWPDDASTSSDSQSPWNTVPGDSALNPPPTTAPWMIGAEIGPQRYIDTSNNWAAGPDFLRGPAVPPFNVDPPAPGFRVAPPINTTPGFNVAPPVDTTPGFRVTDDDPSAPGFRVGNDFPQAAASYFNSYTPLKYDALPGSSSEWPSYDPAVATPRYPSLQEILDRSAHLFDGGNRNQISGLDGGDRRLMAPWIAEAPDCRSAAAQSTRATSFPHNRGYRLPSRLACPGSATTILPPP